MTNIFAIPTEPMREIGLITKVKTASPEEWKPIAGFENRYEVSNLGQVKSLNFHRSGKPQILKQYSDRYGYMKVFLYRNGKPHYLTVHRLVAEAFILNPENKETVDHIDCNRKNNNVENLRWVTAKENNQHSHNLGKQVFNATPIVATSPEGKTFRFNSQREAARASGVKQYAISRALHGEYPDLKGWAFSFD